LLVLVFLNYALILKWLPKDKKDVFVFIALSIFTLAMFYPYFVGPINDFPLGHDQTGRFFETFVTSTELGKMEDAVWSNLWYCGFPVNHFYTPAAKYEGAFYALLFEGLGYSAIDSTILAMKFQTVLAFLFSGFAIYLLLMTLKTSREAAVVGAVAFLVSTWHIQSITISRFAEFYLLPLLLVSYHRSLSRGSFLPIGVIVASLLLTHQHSFLAGAIFLGFYALAKAIQTHAFRPLKIFALAIMSGLGLTTFWSLPYLLEVDRTWGYLYGGFPLNTALFQSLRILESYVSRPVTPTLGWYYPTYVGLSLVFLSLLSVKTGDLNKLPWWAALLGVTFLTLPIVYLTPYFGSLLASLVRAGSTGVHGDRYPDQFGSCQIRLLTGPVMALCYLASAGVDRLSEIFTEKLRVRMPKPRTVFASFTVALILLDFSSSILLIATYRPPIHEELNTWIRHKEGIYRVWTDLDGGPRQAEASIAPIYTGKPFVSGWQTQSANWQLVQFFNAIADMLDQNMPHVPELLGVLNVRYLVIYPGYDNLQRHLLAYPEFKLVESFYNGTVLVYENSKFLPIIRAVIPVYRPSQGRVLNMVDFAQTEYYNYDISFVASPQYGVIETASYERLANLTVSPLTDLHVRLLDDGLTANFKTNGPAYLAISLSDSSDWTGCLDGHLVELFPVEPGMIGVSVPAAGIHTLRLRYSTDNVLHVTADLLTILIITALVSYGCRRVFKRFRVKYNV